jgi:hypothetical protein
LKIDKKRIRRTLYWFVAELAVLAIFILLLAYKPKGYVAAVPDTSGRISTYLTHRLAADFYNGAQMGETFELTVQEDGVNDIIATGGWTGDLGDTRASLPVVHFEPGKVLVMASAYVKGAEFVATIEAKPWIDTAGKFNATLESFKVGAVPVTIAAKAVARKMYYDRIGELPKNDIRALIGSALLDDQPFEPVVEIDGKTVRISKIEVGDRTLKVSFTPIKAR